MCEGESPSSLLIQRFELVPVGDRENKHDDLLQFGVRRARPGGPQRDAQAPGGVRAQTRQRQRERQGRERPAARRERLYLDPSSKIV